MLPKYCDVLCEDVGAGEHRREYSDRSAAGVRHLGQEAVPPSHKVTLSLLIEVLLESGT